MIWVDFPLDGSKRTGRKGYAAAFTDTTRRGALPEEASIHTAEMTPMKEIKEKGQKMGNIYRLVELNAGHREQQSKSLDTKSGISHTNRAP